MSKCPPSRLHVIDGLRGRAARYSGKSLADMTAVQIKIAEAGACIDTARRVMRDHCQTAQALAVVSEVYHRETTEYQLRGAQLSSPQERFFQFPDLMWDVLTRPAAIAAIREAVAACRTRKAA